MAATPVPAATVILLRDGDVSPEVLLLERHAKSEFLPDLYVFPGGRVDAHDPELSYHLPAGGTGAARRALPDTAPELAPALFVAAIRETFEEAGILLARRRGERDLLGAEAAQRLAHHRLDVQGGSLRFGDLVAQEGLELGQLLGRGALGRGDRGEQATGEGQATKHGRAKRGGWRRVSRAGLRPRPIGREGDPSHLKPHADLL